MNRNINKKKMFEHRSGKIHTLRRLQTTCFQICVKVQPKQHNLEQDHLLSFSITSPTNFSSFLKDTFTPTIPLARAYVSKVRKSLSQSLSPCIIVVGMEIKKGDGSKKHGVVSALFNPFHARLTHVAFPLNQTLICKRSILGFSLKKIILTDYNVTWPKHL